MSRPKSLSRSEKTPGKNIALWAINPFELETRPSPAVVEELGKWAAASGFEIQPVHVRYVSTIEAPPDDYGSWVGRFVSAVEVEISNYLMGMNLPSIQPPKVLIQDSGATQVAVDILLNYAREVEARWLLVSSNGRSGLRRMVLGSFAETLLLSSSLPVWVFGHGTPASLDPQRIFFATDFSDLSRSAFEHVVEQAVLLGSVVTLFHCINLPNSMMMGEGIMGVASGFPAGEYLKDQGDWTQKKAQEWIRRGNAAGVEVNFVMKQVVPSIANEIVAEAALAHAGVIALASMSGPVGATLLGSHARQVIRQSECPVWVFGPKCPETVFKENLL